MIYGLPSRPFVPESDSPGIVQLPHADLEAVAHFSQHRVFRNPGRIEKGPALSKEISPVGALASDALLASTFTLKRAQCLPFTHDQKDQYVINMFLIFQTIGGMYRIEAEPVCGGDSFGKIR